MKVLVIEDEADLLQVLTANLKAAGYICETAGNFTAAAEKIEWYEYDLIVLDLTLPGGDGMELLRKLRQEQTNTGVLIISARNALDDKVHGLDFGADDYLTKPFHLAELNARIRSIIRRRHFQGEQTIRFHDMVFDPARNMLQLGERSVELTKKEHDLLGYLLANTDRLLTKSAIAEHLWGDYMDLADNFDLVYTHVKNLRKKVQELGGVDCIKTVYGLGYKLVT